MLWLPLTPTEGWGFRGSEPVKDKFDVVIEMIRNDDMHEDSFFREMGQRILKDAIADIDQELEARARPCPDLKYDSEAGV
jgi:hypothetical protein